MKRARLELLDRIADALATWADVAEDGDGLKGCVSTARQAAGLLKASIDLARDPEPNRAGGGTRQSR